MIPSIKPSSLVACAALITAFALSAFAADKQVKLKTKPYPMTTCVISGEKLDSMGEPFVFTEGDQEVQLCCKSCKKDFEKDKKASLKKIEDAWKTVKPYPSTVCLVSNDAIAADEAVGIVHEGR